MGFGIWAWGGTGLGQYSYFYFDVDFYICFWEGKGNSFLFILNRGAVSIYCIFVWSMFCKSRGFVGFVGWWFVFFIVGDYFRWHGLVYFD